MQENFQLENNNQNQFDQRPPLGRNQKIAAAVLAVFAIAVVFMWAAQFKKSISGPFSNGSENAQTGDQTSLQQEDSEESLRAKDTDGDGLSDWDELYFYKTSPYLEDSDSDGFTDKQEIDNEKDPNCPVGRDCDSSGIVEGDADVVNPGSKADDSDSLNTLMDQLNVDQNLSQSGQAGAGAAEMPAELKAIFGSNMDAATLRQTLLQYGMQKEALDKISDEQLMQSYKEILGG
ncbi:hypothetical protein KJ586_01800 [Patescibacteria group bacterium]|nr:hypothetical protein [Patescibacteria group bacterium]MBU4455227.1 hypothetical protein [Patescibacteria group bacterium]MCG2691008.1 hypothetical protein [Candidatus Parcubacteria bacterium]